MIGWIHGARLLAGASLALCISRGAALSSLYTATLTMAAAAVRGGKGLVLRQQGGSWAYCWEQAASQ